MLGLHNLPAVETYCIYIMQFQAEIPMPPPNWGKSIPFSPLFPGSKCDFHAQDTPSQEGAAEPEGLHLVQGAGEGTEAGSKGQFQQHTVENNPRQQR